MEIKGKKIGFVITGSFYNFRNIIKQMKKLKELEADILPIMSYNSYNLDTIAREIKKFCF